MLDGFSVPALLWCVFRYALRNTLVAKDLEQASRIAYGTRDRRFARVVTVAGQLIAGGCWCSVAEAYTQHLASCSEFPCKDVQGIRLGICSNAQDCLCRRLPVLLCTCWIAVVVLL